MAMNDMDKKTKYFERELWILAWNASVQHATLYKSGAWQNQRDQIDEFRNKVIDHKMAAGPSPGSRRSIRSRPTSKPGSRPNSIK